MNVISRKLCQKQRLRWSLLVWSDNFRARTSTFRFLSSSAEPRANSFEDIPALPSYPLLGSIPYISRLPSVPAETNGPNCFSTAYQLYEKNKIYRVTIPILGNLVVETDPKEFTKVLQNEGKYPYGLTPVIADLGVRKYMPEFFKMIPFHEIFTQGEEHAHARQFLNKGLFAPDTARGYAMIIAKSCELLSQNVQKHENNFDDFLNFASFDMFSAVYFGELMNLADPENANPKNLALVQAIRRFGRDEYVGSNWNAFVGYVGYKFGYKTAWLKETSKLWDVVMTRPRELIENFEEKRKNKTLTELETYSYLYSALNRENDDDDIDYKKLVEQGQIMLTTSADTTPMVMGMLIANLAINLDKQDKLSSLLRERLHGENLNEEIILDSSDVAVEYLNATIRESHRIRPAVLLAAYKKPMKTIHLHGYEIPPGTLIVLDNYSMQNDPVIVEEPEKFLPERFLRDVVKQRKGTPSKIIDHVTLQGPFSSGARMCPAARVVGIELKIFLARLLQDWRFEFEDKSIKDIRDIPIYGPYNQVGAASPMLPKLVITPRN